MNVERRMLGSLDKFVDTNQLHRCPYVAPKSRGVKCNRPPISTNMRDGDDIHATFTDIGIDGVRHTVEYLDQEFYRKRMNAGDRCLRRIRLT